MQRLNLRRSPTNATGTDLGVDSGATWSADIGTRRPTSARASNNIQLSHGTTRNPSAVSSYSAGTKKTSLLLVLVLVIALIQVLATLSAIEKTVTLSPLEQNEAHIHEISAAINEITLKGSSKETLTQVLPVSSSKSATPPHKIPRKLVFTHYHPFLDRDPDSWEDDEERVLAHNVQHSIEMHPGAEVHFLTDQDCVASLKRTYPSLIPFFQNETEGMYKADICRGSALYETGGIYLDVDVGIRKDLWGDLLKTTEFVTVFVHHKSNYPKHFFQAIMGAAPQSPIVHKYLELFHGHYTGNSRVQKGPLGVILLRRAYDAIFDDETVASPAAELYQEVLYHPELFPDLYPAPTWGTRRACHFVVIAKANEDDRAEVWLQDKGFQIPAYSRIPGSRMCPPGNATIPALDAAFNNPNTPQRAAKRKKKKRNKR